MIVAFIRKQEYICIRRVLAITNKQKIYTKLYKIYNTHSRHSSDSYIILQSVSLQNHN